MSTMYEWETYLSYGRKCTYNKNDILYHQGERGDHFYYLQSGTLINRYLSYGGEERYVNHIWPGTLFGEEGMSGNEYISTVVATRDAVVYCFSRDDLLKICKEHKEAASLFIRIQVNNFEQKIEVLRKSDSKIEKKILFYIAEYAHVTNIIPVNQSRLADDLGTSRATINKIFQKWIDEGNIKLNNRKVEVLNRRWLKESVM